MQVLVSSFARGCKGLAHTMDVDLVFEHLAVCSEAIWPNRAQSRTCFAVLQMLN